MASKRRNPYLDMLKGIACIAVIAMHWSFESEFRAFLLAIATRWTMPVFFAISGYFAWKSNLNSCRRKTVHILKITICASLIYLTIALLQHVSDIAGFLRSELTLKNIGAFVVFNSPMVFEKRLWFLYALLYDYLVFWFLTKKGWIKQSYIFIPITLAIHFGVAYTSRALDLGIQAGFVRNWMFEGFPCFMFGHWLHENQARIKDKNPMHWLAAGVALCVGGGWRVFAFRQRLDAYWFCTCGGLFYGLRDSC